jgi:hypothetical protein
MPSNDLVERPATAPVREEHDGQYRSEPGVRQINYYWNSGKYGETNKHQARDQHSKCPHSQGCIHSHVFDAF